MFRRSGQNIHSDLFISIGQAILGGTATTQGLYDTISVLVSTIHRAIHSLSSLHMRSFTQIDLIVVKKMLDIIISNENNPLLHFLP